MGANVSAPRPGNLANSERWWSSARAKDCNDGLVARVEANGKGSTCFQPGANRRAHSATGDCASAEVFIGSSGSSVPVNGAASDLERRSPKGSFSNAQAYFAERGEARRVFQGRFRLRRMA